MKLGLYSVFHLNIAFSSVPEEQRKVVLEKCYWPLLRTARSSGWKIAITATGYTLETIHALDPSWTAELRSLIAEKKIEFIGSGYAQVIGPLVPASVNEHNLRIGQDTYERLLGVRPHIAYINEQTYSAGLVALYRTAEYNALIMEWNNAARYHPEWDTKLRYNLVEVEGVGGARLPLLWNNSIAFQKFQRYAHGELALDEYVEYLLSHEGASYFSLYGNDAEIFDFRPGRYKTEEPLRTNEWERIGALFERLSTETSFFSLFPSEVFVRAQGTLPRIRLESPEQPIIVKKQEKYNLTRWAVTGRDSLTINTLCYRIAAFLEAAGVSGEPLWKELCYAWDSDFRTHITAKRFSAYRIFLDDLLVRAEALSMKSKQPPARTPSSEMKVQQKGVYIHLEHKNLTVVLNTRRGLAIQSLIFPSLCDKPLAGTLLHGHYDNILFGADFYSGSTVIELPGKMRVTDLERVEDLLIGKNEQGATVIEGTVHTSFGSITKVYTFRPDESALSIEWRFGLSIPTPVSFRTGMVTLNPEAFDQKSLYYSCHNGGVVAEKFSLSGVDKVNTDPVSLLVSASMALGNTTGVLELGDAKKKLSLHTDMSACAAVPMLRFSKVDDTFFCRAKYSLAEFDDTTALREGALLPEQHFQIEIRASRT